MRRDNLLPIWKWAASLRACRRAPRATYLDDLLALPLVSYTVTDDPNFAQSNKDQRRAAGRSDAAA